MKKALILCLAGLVAAGAAADTVAAPGAEPIGTEAADPTFRPADMPDLSEFLWLKRPVLVFADSENDPAFAEQIELLLEGEGQLIERDVVVLTDTDPTARSAMRLKMRPRGFMLVIVGKDGQVKLRKPFPWDVREITRSIDKMPIRQKEIRDAKERQGTILE